MRCPYCTKIVDMFGKQIRRWGKNVIVCEHCGQAIDAPSTGKAPPIPKRKGKADGK